MKKGEMTLGQIVALIIVILVIVVLVVAAGYLKELGEAILNKL